MTEIKKVIWESEFDPNTKYPFCPYCKELAYEQDRCVFCGKPYEWVESEGEASVVAVGEYTIVQTSNCHVHLVKDGKIVMHAQCVKKLTEEELKKEIEFYERLQEKNKGEKSCKK